MESLPPLLLISTATASFLRCVVVIDVATYAREVIAAATAAAAAAPAAAADAAAAAEPTSTQSFIVAGPSLLTLMKIEVAAWGRNNTGPGSN